LITISAVKPNFYQDSFKLMRISSEVKQLPGIEQAFAFMGTEMNKKTRASGGLITGEAQEAGPEDLILSVQGRDEQDVRRALEQFESMLFTAQAAQGGSSEEQPPRTLAGGKKKLPGANLAVISVPGVYAAAEAAKALHEGMNVHIFSDNVSLEDEIRLKRLAKDKGLLVMGPDCGTSIIGQVPICFANKVSSGPIGIIGASGTGIQQLTVIIDRMGLGVTHAIGTGGRDLSDAVGAITALMALEALAEDEETKAIVIISKPPGAAAKERVIEAAANIKKPVVLLFLGNQTELGAGSASVYTAFTMEEAAAKAVALAKGEPADGAVACFPREDHTSLFETFSQSLTPDQKYVRGLYTGGSLADEAMHILKSYIGDAYSNIPLRPDLALPDVWKSQGNCVVDLGDDEFTRGRLHPMIDPSYRAERLVQECSDPEVCLILCDLVIGYASHPNPAGVLADAVRRGRETAARPILFIASVCGTEQDPQVLSKQVDILQDAGILVFPSNGYAAEVAGQLAKHIAQRSVR